MCIVRNGVIILLLFLLSSVGIAKEGPLESLQKMGFQLVNSVPSDFNLPLVSGEEKSLSDYKGSWIFLSFWATWCGPCQYEMPALEKLHGQLMGAKIKILGVSTDQGDADKVQRFLNKHNITFPNFLDQSGDVASKYQASSLPSIYVISPDWKLVGIFRGAKNWNTQQIIDTMRGLEQWKIVSSDDLKNMEKIAEQANPTSLLTPPKLAVSLKESEVTVGQAAILECIVSWEGPAAQYSFKTPKPILPPEVRMGEMTSYSSANQYGAKLVYSIPLHFDKEGTYTIGPVELEFSSRMGGKGIFTRSAIVEMRVNNKWWRKRWFFWGGACLLLIFVSIMIYIVIVRKKKDGKVGGPESVMSCKEEASRVQKLKVQVSKREYESELLKLNLSSCNEDEREKIKKMSQEISFGGRELSFEELRYYEKIFNKFNNNNDDEEDI